jgi:hypothetical protein
MAYAYTRRKHEEKIYLYTKCCSDEQNLKLLKTSHFILEINQMYPA